MTTAECVCASCGMSRRSGRLRGLRHRAGNRGPVSGLPGGSDGVRRGSRSDLCRLRRIARPGHRLASNARPPLAIGIGSRRGGRTYDRAADPRRGGRRCAVTRDRSRNGAAARARHAERRARRQARRARRGIASRSSRTRTTSRSSTPRAARRTGTRRRSCSGTTSSTGRRSSWSTRPTRRRCSRSTRPMWGPVGARMCVRRCSRTRSRTPPREGAHRSR